MIRKSLRKVKDERKRRSLRRKVRIRKKVTGTTERPRVCAIKTNKHIQVQVIDDSNQKTLFAMQTFGKSKVGDKANKSSAEQLGKAVGEKMSGMNLKTAVFDRNGKQYCGIVAQLASSIREAGVSL